jgi:pyruvate/2-oxoacid:ferredoxin oxidoreductase alpha subunit/ferredoxin
MRAPETLMRLLRPLLGARASEPSPPPQATEPMELIDALRILDARIGATRAPLGKSVGLAMGGVRVTAALGQEGLIGAAATLRTAVSRHLPLVVQVWGGTTLPSDQGAVHLVASQPQGLIDLCLVARRVAEQALVPCIVSMEHLAGEHPLAIPEGPLAAQLVGHVSDDFEPDAVQQLLFGGATRRRVPAWFDLGRPALHGPIGDAVTDAVRDASHAVWFADQLGQTLDAAMREVGRQTGRAMEAVSAQGRASTVVVATGELASAAASLARNGGDLRVVTVRVLHPFPADAVAAALHGATDVVVLEAGEGTLGGLSRLVEAATKRPVHRVVVAGTPAGQLGALVGGDVGRSARYLGLAVLPTRSAWPKRQALLDTLKRIRPQAPVGVDLSPPKTQPAARRVPLSIRHLTRSDTTFDCLSRFWGEQLAPAAESERTADPYRAVDALPVLTSTLRDLSPDRTVLPTFVPENCTGCGRCWVSCPEAAVGATVLSPVALVEAGMALSASGAGALRPLVSKLAARAERSKAHRAGTMLREAFEPLAAKLPAPRAETMRGAVASAAEALEDLPLAHAALLRHDGWLTIAINPDACKACGACEAVCEEGAIMRLPQTEQLLAATRVGWERWARLPDTPSAVVDRARAHPDIGALAGLLLARSCQLVMAGGDHSEPGSGDRLALRSVLAVAEHALQPHLLGQLADIRDLLERLERDTRDALGAALPAQQLRSALQTGALPSAVAHSIDRGELDTDALAHLVDLEGSLTALRERLASGPDGLGRARLGLVLVTGGVAEWAATYPENPFQVPAVVARPDDAPALARGLLDAQVGRHIREMALLREARRAVRRAKAGTPTRWDDLDDAERRQCPPLVLVAREGALSAPHIRGLLVGGMPIKVLLLAEAESDQPHASGLLGLAHRGVFVLQASIGDSQHFCSSIEAALAHVGPALLRVHAPSPTRDGYDTADTMAFATEAVRSGAFPVFRFDPGSDDPLLERARTEVSGELVAAHAAELEALRSRHRAELAALQQQQAGTAVDRLHRRLVHLASPREEHTG